MAGVPASSHGSSGFPSQWTVSAFDGSLDIDNPGDETYMKVTDSLSGKTVVLDSKYGVSSSPWSPAATVIGGSGPSGLTGLLVDVLSFGGQGLRVLANGALVLRNANAAPATGDLTAGDCGLYFDKTNGASTLNIKGKSSDGTVVTATIPLT